MSFALGKKTANCDKEANVNKTNISRELASSFLKKINPVNSGMRTENTETWYNMLSSAISILRNMLKVIQ
jgi:hypothetical protein